VIYLRLVMGINKKVLYVFEDDPTFRSSYVSLLEQMGWEIYAFESPVQCSIQELKAHNPKGCSLDISMPGMSGLAFAAELRKDPDFADFPIIFVTSQHQEGYRKAAQQLGCRAYFVKYEIPLQEIVSWIAANLHQ
jgi:CheY-like chemotaxis protein